MAIFNDSLPKFLRLRLEIGLSSTTYLYDDTLKSLKVKFKSAF